MAGTGRIYRRGAIYYIAYRWDGREYRESARSPERGDAERLLATRLAERQGYAGSGDSGPFLADHGDEVAKWCVWKEMVSFGVFDTAIIGLEGQ